MCRKALNLGESKVVMECSDAAVEMFSGSLIKQDCDEMLGDVAAGITCGMDQKDCNSPAIRISSTEVSAIVDGENAMFPDSIDAEVTKEDFCSPSSAQSANVSYEDGESEADAMVSKNKLGTSDTASQHDVKAMFATMLEKGWNLKDCSDVTVAELYLMLGQDGLVKLEYDWISLLPKEDLIHDKILITLNNMLRRLSHLATLEITDFSKVKFFTH